jgi:hypothetical protein
MIAGCLASVPHKRLKINFHGAPHALSNHATLQSHQHTDTNMKSFPASSKFLLIYQEASFFTTAKTIRTRNVGAYQSFNAACLYALEALEQQRFTPDYEDKSMVDLKSEWLGYELEIQYIHKPK